ncbi:hypothetical protein BGZ73_005066 [Actinomortierella ambigua]|nr:hypothetical protein BGZ73_005066 [Actinomortierella ambigua]
MHQSLIIATVACFAAALTATVDASPVIKHKYADTAAFKPYFCNAFHTGCRRYCSYEYQYLDSTCKASKNKKYFTVACNCKDAYPDHDFTSGVLSHTKQTAQRVLENNLERDDERSITNYENALKADCKATCKGSKTTAKFTLLPPKEPQQYGVDYSFECRCGKHYVNDLIDYWVRVHWDL